MDWGALVSNFELEKLHTEYLVLRDRYADETKAITQGLIPQMVYDSNAIEGSTVNLLDTVKILKGETNVHVNSGRELYETRNLGELIKYLQKYPNTKITVVNILKWHKMLMVNYRNDIGGRFRNGKEWVKVGNFVAANPEFVPQLVNEIVDEYYKSNEYLIDKIAHFHAEFETIHPFNDGNGRIGRVIINQQLAINDFPPIIIPNNRKEKDYYPLFSQYHQTWDSTNFAKYFEKLLFASLQYHIKKLGENK
jgi:Fic family protein